jgi:hypothetical protein
MSIFTKEQLLHIYDGRFRDKNGKLLKRMTDILNIPCTIFCDITKNDMILVFVQGIQEGKQVTYEVVEVEIGDNVPPILDVRGEERPLNKALIIPVAVLPHVIPGRILNKPPDFGDTERRINKGKTLFFSYEEEQTGRHVYHLIWKVGLDTRGRDYIAVLGLEAKPFKQLKLYTPQFARTKSEARELKLVAN